MIFGAYFRRGTRPDFVMGRRTRRGFSKSRLCSTTDAASFLRPAGESAQLPRSTRRRPSTISRNVPLAFSKSYSSCFPFRTSSAAYIVVHEGRRNLRYERTGTTRLIRRPKSLGCVCAARSVVPGIQVVRPGAPDLAERDCLQW